MGEKVCPRLRIAAGRVPGLRQPLGSQAGGAVRVYFPFFDSKAASLNCLNENVLGSESATHLAFHITLLDHVGVETGREGTLELVPHIYSSLDI